jgi:hypothetical protein
MDHAYEAWDDDRVDGGDREAGTASHREQSTVTESSREESQRGRTWRQREGAGEGEQN